MSKDYTRQPQPAKDKVFRGILNAILSSSSFGFAPFFSITLLAAGLSGCEVLTYRWGTATAALLLFGIMTGKDFRIRKKEAGKIFLLSLFRATTSASLIVAYSNMASGAASTIHFMYPVVVSLCMMFFFGERKSPALIAAALLSFTGAYLLASGDSAGIEDGNTVLGIAASVVSVFSYAGYFILMRQTGADKIEPVKLTCYVMGLGSIYFMIGGAFTGGIEIVRDPELWLYIAGLGIVATTLSNFSLVKAISMIGPTLTSIFGALEPLTAVVMGVIFFSEKLSATSIAGMVIIFVTVTATVICQKKARQ